MEFPYVLARLSGEENAVEITLMEPTADRRGGMERQFHAYITFDTTLTQGRSQTWIAFEDLDEWETFIRELAAGRDAAWREFGRDIEMKAEHDATEPTWRLTVKDPSYRVRVVVDFDVDDAWLAVSLARLEAVREFIGTE